MYGDGNSDVMRLLTHTQIKYLILCNNVLKNLLIVRDHQESFTGKTFLVKQSEYFLNTDKIESVQWLIENDKVGI